MAQQSDEATEAMRQLGGDEQDDSAIVDPWNREHKAIYSVENSSVSVNDNAAIFDIMSAFDRTFGEIAELGGSVSGKGKE